MSDKPIDFKEQMRLERQYYLGKSETIPGSDKTISEVRKEYREAVAEEDARMEARRQAYFEKLDAKPGIPVPVTTAVTHGVLVDIKPQSPAAVPDKIFADPNSPSEPTSLIPDKEELEGMKKDELLAVASENNLPEFAGNATKADIIKALMIRRREDVSQ